MAIDLTLKSTAITNREATPRVLNNAGTGGYGIVRGTQGYLASVTAALSITSVIRMCEIDAYAIMDSLAIQSAAQTAGKVDIGLYRTNADGGAVVDADFFASAVDLANAVAITDVLNESTSNTIAKQYLPLWNAAGVSTAPAPGTKYDICLTVVTTDFTTAAGAVGVKARYII
jgi:hypothetical protein